MWTVTQTVCNYQRTMLLNIWLTGTIEERKQAFETVLANFRGEPRHSTQ